MLVQVALVFASGGESCLDIADLQTQEDRFSPATSDSTAWRAFRELSPRTPEGPHQALTTVRDNVLAPTAPTRAGCRRRAELLQKAGRSENLAMWNIDRPAAATSNGSRD